MFGFFRRKDGPKALDANPGMCFEGKVAFANGERNWVETFNAVKLAEQALRNRGFHVKREKTWLEHRESGYQLLPQFVEMQILDDGGVHTVTSMQVNHPQLAPAGLFEFQHSAADNIEVSIRNGYDMWVQGDFVTLLEAARTKPENCAFMEMSFPKQEEKPARTRRAVLGPVAHFMTKPPSNTEGGSEAEHPFCACCLLTRSFEAFKELMEADGFFGLRLFAARDENGEPQADCRVNGEDWEQGAVALRAYAQTWDPAGYEFRKQYVVLQSVEGAHEFMKLVGGRQCVFTCH